MSGHPWSMLGAIAALALAPVSTAYAADASLTDGQALFRQRCGVCHFEHGFGANILARRVGVDKSLLETRTDLEAAYIHTSVRLGVGSMPRFTKVELPDAELRAITAYLGRR
jgi:mono/diheme cytochrome c family protein